MNYRLRIKEMKIIRSYLIKYLDCLPCKSKDKALSLILDIDNELNWFKLQELKRTGNSQMKLF